MMKNMIKNKNVCASSPTTHISCIVILILCVVSVVSCTSDEFLDIMNKEGEKRINYFPNTKLGSYWTSSEYEFFDDYGIKIDFRDGNINAELQSKLLYARCVANTVDIIHSDQHHTYYFDISDTGQDRSFFTGDDGYYDDILQEMTFLDPGDGTIIDSVTGLIWTKCTMVEGGKMDGSGNCTGSHATYSWLDAIDACENLDFSERIDWKLPTFSELSSIVDYGVANPAIR